MCSWPSDMPFAYDLDLGTWPWFMTFTLGNDLGHGQWPWLSGMTLGMMLTFNVALGEQGRDTSCPEVAKHGGNVSYALKTLMGLLLSIHPNIYHLISIYLTRCTGVSSSNSARLDGSDDLDLEMYSWPSDMPFAYDCDLAIWPWVLTFTLGNDLGHGQWPWLSGMTLGRVLTLGVALGEQGRDTSWPEVVKHGGIPSLLP